MWPQDKGDREQRWTWGRGWWSWLYRSQAKSVCRPSSREMSSLEKVRPGMSRRFLSQKMAQKEPLKWMPSTHANATSRSAKLSAEPIQCCAQRAFLATHGSVCVACRRPSRREHPASAC